MNIRRRALSLTAIAAVAFALVPTPSFAASIAELPAWACRAGDSAPVDTFVGRGGKVREKELVQVHNDLPPRAQGKAPANLSVTVPVWFHVVTNGSLGNLTDRQIDAQIAVLNREYRASDTGFAFDLAGVTRTNNAAWYASKSGGAEHDMKVALKTGGDGTLNVYATSAGAFLGWAYLPEITESAQAYLDGVVFSWETVPGASDTYAGVYDEGLTLVHEVGHWLNLEHTFYGGCNKSGDFVDDTPAMKTPTFGCPAGKDTCPKAPGLDPIHNYMDYSDDPCLTQFTPGQVQRMQDSWLFYRAS